MSRNIYSVGQVNRYIKNLFSQDYFLREIAVQGEVSNCKYHTSGHIYFSLKDSTGALSCMMFSGYREELSFRLRDGDRVVVKGTVDVYERDGRYQLYAREITRAGIGDLYRQYLQLKEQLEEMGMFSPEYKLPIPKYVKRLGVVTAPTGAAVQDIRNVALRRNPYVQIILYPAQVQGDGAAETICRGIQKLDELGVDVIIVGRGGGSIEDLWAFNEESVARAVFACKTPVISAVGHETDFTIIDFVADLRAPTPSAAAELAVFDCRELVDTLRHYRERLGDAMERVLFNKRMRWKMQKLKWNSYSPEYRLADKKASLDDYRVRICVGMQDKLLSCRHQFDLYVQRFKGLSPLNKLSGGYAYVQQADTNKAVTGAAQLKENDRLFITFVDGLVEAEVKKIMREEE